MGRTYTFKVKTKFSDMEKGIEYQADEILTTERADRIEKFLNMNLVNLLKITNAKPSKA